MSDTVHSVTDTHRRQFAQEGYFILENVLSVEHLKTLRGAAQFAVDRADGEMDAAGVDQLHLNHRGKRYFSAMVYKERPELRGFLFSDLMADVCRSTLGPNAFLFWEQYVIKAADKGMKFSWHQDSGYVGHPYHQPYLTCWIALDDVTEENGTVYILPYSQCGIRTYVQHIKDAQSDDMVGYFGEHSGVPVIVPAGSIVCFSSYVFHCSGANLTDKMRRVYLAQYSSEIILDRDGKQPLGSAEPFLKDGIVVARA